MKRFAFACLGVLALVLASAGATRATEFFRVERLDADRFIALSAGVPNGVWAGNGTWPCDGIGFTYLGAPDAVHHLVSVVLRQDGPNGGPVIVALATSGDLWLLPAAGWPPAPGPWTLFCRLGNPVGGFVALTAPSQQDHMPMFAFTAQGDVWVSPGSTDWQCDSWIVCGSIMGGTTSIPDPAPSTWGQVKSQAGR